MTKKQAIDRFAHRKALAAALAVRLLSRLASRSPTKAASASGFRAFSAASPRRREPGFTSPGSTITRRSTPARARAPFSRGGRLSAGLNAQADLDLRRAELRVRRRRCSARRHPSPDDPASAARAEVDATLTGPRGDARSPAAAPTLGDRRSAISIPQFVAEMERGRPQLHGLRRPATSRSATTIRTASPISASGMARSTAASATPISIRRPGTNSPSVLGFTYNFENTRHRLSERRRLALSTGAPRSS